MIANYFRKAPGAMARQMVLPLGLPVWNGSRPTTRAGRAMRAARTAAYKLIDKIQYPTKAPTPDWVTDAKRRARALANSVKSALMAIDFTDPTSKTKAEAIETFIQARLAAEEQRTGRAVTWPRTSFIRAAAMQYVAIHPELFPH